MHMMVHMEWEGTVCHVGTGAQFLVRKTTQVFVGWQQHRALKAGDAAHWVCGLLYNKLSTGMLPAAQLKPQHSCVLTVVLCNGF